MCEFAVLYFALRLLLSICDVVFLFGPNMAVVGTCLR